MDANYVGILIDGSNLRVPHCHGHDHLVAERYRAWKGHETKRQRTNRLHSHRHTGWCNTRVLEFLTSSPEATPGSSREPLRQGPDSENGRKRVV
jgi:hypothetical protein